MKTIPYYYDFMRISYSYILILGTAFSLLACNGFLGEETPTDFLDVPIANSREVAYVPIQPVVSGFSRPVDIIAGWDGLLYIADAGTEEIIALDQAGNELGRFSVPGLVAITQDRRLDIIALGRMDTTINNSPLNLATIYRLDLNKTGDYGLNNARITNKVVHPFYVKSGTPNQRDVEVSFTGITILGNNQYYVARNGNANSSNQFGGPDDAILRFQEDDGFISPISVKNTLGITNSFFRKPQGISSKAVPPQTLSVNSTGDFLFTSIDPNNLLKVQLIQRIETDGGAEFVVQNLISGDTSRADGFLYEPGRFTQPVDVAIAGDGTGYLFVVDSETDSLYQFNGLGLEGVNPPPGSRSSRNVLVSFGGTGDGLSQFREPGGVAYLDRIVYVADTGNGRVLRFKLTTDFD